jgi:hypothetical protein
LLAAASDVDASDHQTSAHIALMPELVIRQSTKSGSA